MRRFLNSMITGLFCAFGILSLIPSANVVSEEEKIVDIPSQSTVVTGEIEEVVVPMPAVEALGWVLMDGSNGRVLAGEGIDQELPIASTTKIMTSLLALEQEDTQEFFMVGEEILVEGSSMGLVLGDNINLYGLATGMLLSSGNDAANAVAIRVGGSFDGFAQLMNERGEELGMKNTLFTTPSGLDQDGNHSTAYDLGLLAVEALKNEDFLYLCSTQTQKIQKGTPLQDYTLENHNRLLSLYDQAIGVKTGYTEKAGRCLVSAAKQDGLTLVLVTLNCSDDFNTHEAVYRWAFEQIGYHTFTTYTENLSMAVVGGMEDRVTLVSPWELGGYLLPTESASVEIALRIPQFVYAPVEKGQRVGEIQLTKAGVSIATVPLLAGEDIEQVKIGAIQRFWEKISDFL